MTGRLKIKGPAGGFLMFGWSYQHLWWYDAAGGRELVLHSSDETSAGRCPECGLVAFVPGAPG